MIRSAVTMDPSITASMLELALAALRGESLIRAGDRTEVGTGEILTDIVTIKDVCKLLRATRSTVNRMIKKGILIRVFGSGNKRSIGLTRDSVVKVLRGMVNKKGRARK